MPNLFRKKFLSLLSIAGCLIFSQLRAQDWKPDLSIGMEEFQAKALQPKEEVWVVDFWASWCRPCIASIPHLKELHSKYQGKPVRFLSLSWDDDRMDWARTVAHFQLPWNMLLIDTSDPQQVGWMEDKFPHKGIPTAFVISREGKLKKVGDVYDLEEYVEKALAK
jgi:thiol-disulfide isomerase/thioredoxin